MRTLFVTYHYLHGTGGGVFASRGYVNAFAELSEQMTLLCAAKPGLPPDGIHPSVQVVPVLYEKPKWLKFMDLLAGRIHRFFSVFDRVLAAGDYDVVVFDASYASFRLIRKARRKGCRVLTIHHNYQCDYVRDNDRFPVRLPMLFWTRICERSAIRESDLNLVLTEADRQLLRENYDPAGKSAFAVIGVFEYLRKGIPAVSPLPEAPVFVATGDMSMPQTAEPLLEWMERYLPVLREEIPQAHVIFAGKQPVRQLVDACRRNQVELIPSPEDMQAVLRRGRYYLCPTSKGSGLKLRMMDGLKNGMPVLAHTLSARGYEPFIGTEVFCYDGPDSFRASLREMTVRPHQAEEAVRRYHEVFSFEAGLGRLKAILDPFLTTR